MDIAVLDAMRRQWERAEREGDTPVRRAHAASNLGTALLDRANRMDDLSRVLRHFSETEEAFTEALQLEAANEHSAAFRANLALVTKCRQLVSAYKLFNPLITQLGADAGCERIILRRLQKGQLSATLFTCDGRADAGLLWMYEAEALDPAAWAESLRDGLPTRRALAYDARVMPAARWAGIREGELAMDEAKREREGGVLWRCFALTSNLSAGEEDGAGRAEEELALSRFPRARVLSCP